MLSVLLGGTHRASELTKLSKALKAENLDLSSGISRNLVSLLISFREGQLPRHTCTNSANIPKRMHTHTHFLFVQCVLFDNYKT